MSFVQKITSQIKEGYINGTISLVLDKIKAQAFFNYIPIGDNIGYYYFRDEDSNIIFYITFTSVKTSSTSGDFSMTIGNGTNTQIIRYVKDSDTLTTSGDFISFAGVIDDISTYGSYYAFNSSYGAALYYLQIWEQNRLQSVLGRIVSKMTSYKTYSNKLCSRFVEARTISTTRSMASGFSGGGKYIVAYGGLQDTYDSAEKSSNFSTGNITNVTYDTLQLSDDNKEEWTKCAIFACNLISGNAGGLKSYYCTTANSSYAYRAFTVSAVVTADKTAQFHGGPVICKYPSILS